MVSGPPSSQPRSSCSTEALAKDPCGTGIRPVGLDVSHNVPDNFLGLDAQAADYHTARFAVLPIPYDATTTFGSGTRHGPRAIITASQQVELYDEELGCEPVHGGVATLDPLQPDARGPEAMHKRICDAARPIVRDGKFLIGLGGEHSITSGLVRAVKSRHKSLSVLQIDAHADLRNSYQGTPYSHACVMRRIHDLGVRAVGVGIRNYSAEEARFIKRHRKPIFTARTCRDSSSWIDDAIAHLSDHVYVTIDVDGFDPAYAPGTGTPEPGGLDWYQVVDLLEAVTRSRCVAAADVVEVRPLPPGNVTEFLAAKLIYRLIALAASS
uniref:N(1)-aminopropylagmatine ureohydrolase n=1 Tax=uncultured Planctomycetota bacterium TaxID=120965 RepID=A0A5B8KHW9_9BACT|nr:N(1)-aminopropylagmatine ureohydrolase [uncultured Planctomycetota bacterium]